MSGAPDATAICGVLRAHRVRHLVLGTFAAIAQGAALPAPRVVEVTADTAIGNLNRLADALAELGASPRGADAPITLDGATLGRRASWRLACAAGALDVTFYPSGFGGGYGELVRRARAVSVAGEVVRVADLHDVARSALAAGRLEDFSALPALVRRLRAA